MTDKPSSKRIKMNRSMFLVNVSSLSSRAVGTDFPDSLSLHPSLSVIAPGRFSKQSCCR